MSQLGPSGLRGAIAVEAARLMYEEHVKQYFTAKRLAAKRLLGRTGARRLRCRPVDLPSNGEIRDELLRFAERAEGEARTRRLFAMRVVALRVMQTLEPFEPRLIGSVSTGHIRRGSDIDLHVFTDDPDALLEHLRGQGYAFETERVSILKFGQIREYMHVHVHDAFEVELTVYERREVRFRPRSSTDGRPIERVKPLRLLALLQYEHAAQWQRYLAEGTLEGLADEGDGDDARVRDLTSWDGILASEPARCGCPAGEAPGSEGIAAGAVPDHDHDHDHDHDYDYDYVRSVAGGDDDEGTYDPLPGFEDA